MMARACSAVTQPCPGSSQAASEAPVATSNGTTIHTLAGGATGAHPHGRAASPPATLLAVVHVRPVQLVRVVARGLVSSGSAVAAVVAWVGQGP